MDVDIMKDYKTSRSKSFAHSTTPFSIKDILTKDDVDFKPARSVYNEDDDVAESENKYGGRYEMKRNDGKNTDQALDMTSKHTVDTDSGNLIYIN